MAMRNGNVLCGLRYNDTEKKAVQRSVGQFTTRVEPTVAEEPVAERPPVVAMPHSNLEPSKFNFPQDRSGEAGSRESDVAPTVVQVEQNTFVPATGITFNFVEGILSTTDPVDLPLSRANLA